MHSLSTQSLVNGHAAGFASGPPDLAAASGRPLRVGFVVHVMQVAGAEVLVSETIQRLGGRIQPTVFCLDAIGALGELLQARGVPLVCLGRRPGRDWKVGWRMAREFRSRRIDVVHAHQYTPFFYSALGRALMRNPPKLILTEHGRAYPDRVSPLRRTVNRLVLDHLADEINACCRFSGRALARVDGFAGHRIGLIANGIDVERYGTAEDRAALRRSLGLDPARRYVIAVARFHPVKDHAMLLRAFAAVAAARPDVDLLLAGDGPLREDLQTQARAPGIADRVRFLGVRRDVPQLLQAADVYALTSLSEAASLTILEAMASRLPVVVTAVGGNAEIVRHGIDGLLVPRGDDAAAAAALLEILDDPGRGAAMGASGRARVELHYRLSGTIDRYWRLYQRLGGRRVESSGRC
jgi:glycosyltransferase involved in cell wall biosynthesis